MTPRANLSVACGSREVIRTNILVRNAVGKECFSTNAMDLAERWATANAERGPFTIERVQEVRLRTVLAKIEAPEPASESARAEALNARIRAQREDAA